MILSDTKILKEIDKGSIVIKPFDIKNINPTGYDLHLDSKIEILHLRKSSNQNSKYFTYPNDFYIDCKKEVDTECVEIAEEGFLLRPNELYLARTVEFTETNKYVPFIEGKSGLARLGLSVHSTAGKGEIGYTNYFTLELTCVYPTIIYPNMPIAQIYYQKIKGKVSNTYKNKKNNYNKSKSLKSQYYKQFTKE